jgi:uncharacterized NAD(P)/FAD-binding protein YdhS
VGCFPASDLAAGCPEIEAVRNSGQMEVLAARLRSVAVEGEKLNVRLRQRGHQKSQEMAVQRIINCTGPQSDYARIEHPLLAQLRQYKLIQPDSLHLGLKALPDGRLIQTDGKPSCSLFTIGPALRGALWESTAVPEISEQAAHLAKLYYMPFFRTGICKNF